MASAFHFSEHPFFPNANEGSVSFARQFSSKDVYPARPTGRVTTWTRGKPTASSHGLMTSRYAMVSGFSPPVFAKMTRSGLAARRHKPMSMATESTPRPRLKMTGAAVFEGKRPSCAC